ncbi:MAG: hypothetical protein QNI84_13445 [Henriciella sp.]|nr:hypothetical protein [Henriciella sp.]
MATNTPPTEQELRDAGTDLDTIGQFVNAPADVNGDGTINTRTGGAIEVLAKIRERADIALAEIDGELVALIGATTYADRAAMDAVTPTELPARAEIPSGPDAGFYEYSVDESGWLEFEPQLSLRVEELEDRVLHLQPPRHDVAFAQVTADGKRITHVRPDGRHVHNHKAGSIKTEELEEGGKLAAVPAATLLDGSLWDFIAIGQDNKRIWGVRGEDFYGPSSGALVSRSELLARSAPDLVSGKVRRSKLLTVATAETHRTTNDDEFIADAVSGAFERLPDLPAECFSFQNVLAEEVEFRRAAIDLDGLNYRGTWDPATPVPHVSSDVYRMKRGWYYHISATANGFTEGDRLVFIGAHASSTAFDNGVYRIARKDGTTTDENGNTVKDVFGTLWREVPGGRFYRGEWSPASAAYPSDANLVAGDTYAVSAPGLHDGETYAYGDYLVKTATGWRREAQHALTVVTSGGSVELTCPTGSLREWEVRKATLSEYVSFLDLRAIVPEIVTARVHDVDGRRQIWLHNANGGVDKLTDQNVGNSYAPQFDGSTLMFKSDRSGEELPYIMSVERMPGRFGRAMEVLPARSNKVVTVGDSYGTRWGPSFIRQIEYDDQINGRRVARDGADLNGGSLDDNYISSILTALGEGVGHPDHLSGIVSYVLDWNNGRAEERAEILQALAAVRGRTPRFLVTGNAIGRQIAWDGAQMVVGSNFNADTQKQEDEARLEEIMGGEFFEGGNYANMRKYGISSRNPRFDPNDWDPVLQMSVGDVANTYGIWGLWTIVGIDDVNYPQIRTQLNEANFQGYIDNESQRVSATDWHYYVATGDGDLTANRVHYFYNGDWFNLGTGDGVHWPSADTPFYTDPDVLTVKSNGDVSNIINMMAYDVVTELSARGWLD